MNHRSYRFLHTERHLKLWIYLLPIVGIVPAIWTLYFSPGSWDRSPKRSADALLNRSQKKLSRLSLTLALVWLSCYSLLSLGGANTSEVLSFRLLYANAIVTTIYFVTCTILMSRLGNKGLSAIDRIDETH